ncbi:hypothetical protein H0N98_02940 [Candidatus Micrarchaeota archaeon]|nr:hypothetical protein [Candidatus Micrarchaeota archaeon]
MYRLLEPEEGKVLARFQNFYPTSFHEKVSKSSYMDKFYEKAVSVSGITNIINESEKPVTIVDIAGGRGRFKDAVEKVAEKKFNYVVVDLSREQLGKFEDLRMRDKEKKGERFKVVGDMSSVPISGADAAVLLNTPNVILGFYSDFVEKYISKYKEFFQKKYDGLFEEEVSKKVLERLRESEEGRISILLGAMMTSVDKLHILEAVKLLKENGVLIIGGFAQAISAYPIDEMKGIPLKVRDVEEFRLNRNVMKLWRDYSGDDLENNTFFVASFTKTGEVAGDLIEGCEKIFKDSFHELLKSKRFWEVLNELEKIEKEKKEAADEIHKVAKVIKE